MAKQNFLSGGYYGKLGQTVGQRWKNLRTIRAYVIPTDPRTPDQVAQRKKFGSGVFYAQIARQANSKCTLFKSPSMTEWNKRMSVAIENKKMYSTFLTILPLIPEGVQAPFNIESGGYVYNSINDTLEITASGLLPETARTYSIIITNNESATSADDIKILTGTSTAENPEMIITSKLNGFMFSPATKVRIVSNDDSNSSSDMVLSNEMTLTGQGIIDVPITLTVQSVTTTGANTVIIFNNDYISGIPTIELDGANVELNGEKRHFDIATGTYSNVGGKMALTVVQGSYTAENQIAFGTESNIEIALFQVLTETHRYFQENADISATQLPVPTREYQSTLTSLSIIDNRAKFVEKHDHILMFADRIGAVLPSECNGYAIPAQVWQTHSVQTDINGQTQIFNPPTVYAPAGTNQFGIALKGTESTFTLGARTVVIRGVKYTLTPTAPVAISNGAFGYTFNPVWTSQVDTTNQLRALSDVYCPDTSFTPISKQISYTRNYLEIKPSATGFQKTGYYERATEGVIQIRLSGARLPAIISCYFTAPSAIWSTGHAHYGLNATPRTLYFNQTTGNTGEMNEDLEIYAMLDTDGQTPRINSPLQFRIDTMEVYQDSVTPWNLVEPTASDPYNYFNFIYLKWTGTEDENEMQEESRSWSFNEDGLPVLEVEMDEPFVPFESSNTFEKVEIKIDRNANTTENCTLFKIAQQGRTLYFVQNNESPDAILKGEITEGLQEEMAIMSEVE